MGRFFSPGRFAYATGFTSRDAAQDAFNSMCAEGEMSPGEGKIEPYQMRKAGRNVTRYAVTVPT